MNCFFISEFQRVQTSRTSHKRVPRFKPPRNKERTIQDVSLLPMTFSMILLRFFSSRIYRTICVSEILEFVKWDIMRLYVSEMLNFTEQIIFIYIYVFFPFFFFFFFFRCFRIIFSFFDILFTIDTTPNDLIRFYKTGGESTLREQKSPPSVC
jgi:hypothetical protein